MNESQALDRDAFQRVWRRVMPEDRADVPFTLDAPGQTLPPAPRPPAGPPRPQPPPPSPRPTPQPGPRPPVCLGEGSRGELPQLGHLIELTAGDRRVYRAQARRWPGERLFARLAQAKESQLRKLTAARFLIEGKRRPLPSGPAPRVPGSLSQVLRERHRVEQERAMAFFQAGGASRDPCLIALYREIGRENQQLAGQIRARLERQR